LIGFTSSLSIYLLALSLEVRNFFFISEKLQVDWFKHKFHHLLLCTHSSIKTSLNRAENLNLKIIG